MVEFLKRLSGLMLAALLLCGGPVSAVAGASEDASAYTDTIAQRALAVLSAKSSDATKQKELEALFVKIVDTDWIARFVLGTNWRRMEASQQKEYLDTYRRFLVKHYVSNFREFTVGTSFKVVKSRPIGSGRDQFLVGMQVLRPKTPQPVSIDYRLKQENKEFRVIDIVVEGVSLLATQRSEFASVIQRDGLERLLQLLKKKSA
jgi:phospholipid transport system substrate-binding protein